MNVFHEFYAQGKFERSLNATFTVLILKKVLVVDIKDFRLISLVSGGYEFISKVLANRKAVLEKVISRSQIDFIKGRQILGIVIIANECLNSKVGLGVPGLLL
jgi:predicted phosphoribosyltransferase